MEMKLVQKIFFFFCVFISLNEISAQDIPEDKKKEIEIILGIDKVERLDFNPSTKIQIGNESILNYQIVPQKKELIFKGLKPGQTSVIVRDAVGDIKSRYLVTITENDNSKTVQELKEFLGDIEGIEIGIKGNQVYVGGEIVVPDQIGKINTVLRNYEKVVPLVELAPQSQVVVAQKMQDEINKISSLKDIVVRVVNKVYWLEGVVPSPGDRTTAQRIAEAFLPDQVQSLAERTESVQQMKGKLIIQNFISINEQKQESPPPKLIKITAQFVELSKDYSKTFGMKWSPTFGEIGGEIRVGKTPSGGVSTNTGGGGLSATLSNLFPKLRSAKEAGHARIIQSGVILVENNTDGQIKKTSKKNFALGSGEFTRASQAEAGFDMQVKPTVIGEDQVKLGLGLSVSSSIGDPPEIQTNDIKTAVTIKTAETAVIGGIAINKSKTDYDRVPRDDLGTGTPLFEFVRSKSTERDKGQFVVFITPEIIESASVGTEEIKKKFRHTEYSIKKIIIIRSISI